jgi:hypothetical protein
MTSTTTPIAASVTPDQAREIARDAYVYGSPMVDNYRILYSYFTDKDDPTYRGPWNQVHNTARLYTPADTAVQTPNSDTPYSFIGADLRTEPLILTIPQVEAGRYYSVQFVDSYTYNFAYVGSRTTGNDGGRYLLAGPSWTGDTPTGIDAVLQCDTDFAVAIYRTQLFGPDDIDNVRTIQTGYQVQPLSAFLNQPPPPALPTVDFVKPLTAEQQKTDPEFFHILSFILKYVPTLPSEQDLRARFASIGIGPDNTFNAATLSPDMRAAIEGGIADAWSQFSALLTDKINTGQVDSGDVFGTREMLNGNYLYRMAAAVIGIYGNTKAEAFYPTFSTDSDGAPLTGASNYTYRFPPGELPPVNAFWSLTMYELPSSLLVTNSIDRYLINSTMLDSLTKDPDGGITLYVQTTSPGTDREANWLPAPTGPFRMFARLYWPKQEALDGQWTAPQPHKT